MKATHTTMALSAANAVLFDQMSAAFAYPDREVLEGLYDSLRQPIEALDCTSLREPAQQCSTALDSCALPGKQQQLESDYIALFELNPQQPPLHLNAHLYAEGKPEPVPVYQRLVSFYREFGIELRDGEGVERPDHLIVQLEFMGYLYRILGEALRGESERAVESIESAIDAFHAELAWIPRWLAMLEERGGHPLYSPLGRLLEALLQCTAKTP